MWPFVRILPFVADFHLLQYIHPFYLPGGRRLEADNILMVAVLARQPIERDNNSGTLPFLIVYTTGFDTETVLLIQVGLESLRCGSAIGPW